MELWHLVPNGTEEVLRDRKCPACGSTRTHRSHIRKGSWERLLRAVTPFRPFSCSECRWRGWRIPLPAEAPALPPIALKPGGPGKLKRSTAAAERRRRNIMFLIGLVIGVVALGIYIVR